MSHLLAEKGKGPGQQQGPQRSAGSSAASSRREAAGSQRLRGQPKPQKQWVTSPGLELRPQDFSNGREEAERKLPNWEKPAGT